tara:strand:+ start:186 stop:467 length:282 start_codon:yes stop_codon:yes gene_type:complete
LSGRVGGIRMERGDLRTRRTYLLQGLLQETPSNALPLSLGRHEELSHGCGNRGPSQYQISKADSCGTDALCGGGKTERMLTSHFLAFWCRSIA